MKQTGKTYLILTLLCCPQNGAAFKHDPKLAWSTLETTHFSVHYHQGEEALAHKTAAIAEEVHRRHVATLRWFPTGKTHVILTDEYDVSNGFATPYPYNAMTLYVTQPAAISQLNDYDDWLRELITHEYTHIVHLDTVRGFWDWAQHVFGRPIVSFPNLFQPLWMIEGLAVLEETDETSGGRGRSAFFDMMLRTAALEGRLNTLDQMTGFLTTWPGGTVAYLYGVSFYQYIQQRYGKEKPVEISLMNASRILPMFWINQTAKRVLGEGYDRIYQDWKKTQEEKYQEQLRQIQRRPITEAQPLTRRGYLTGQPLFSPQGDLITYVTQNQDDFPSIRLMQADGTGDRRIVPRVIQGNLSWSPEGQRLAFAYLERYRSFNLYGDLAFFDLRSKKIQRLTHGIRAKDVAWSPNGKTLLFVQIQSGLSHLALFDLATRQIIPLGPRIPEASFDQPVWSPDGSSIAVSIWKPGGYRDIHILKSDGTEERMIQHDRANEVSPSWSSDSRTLYYSSDRTGVYNIFAYELASGTVRQVTNVIGGAFYPTVSPDGKKLVFAGYSSRGFDLYAMALDPAHFWGVEPYRDPHPAIPATPPEVAMSSHSYSAFPTVLPHYWLPLLVLTGGVDALNKHAWFAQWGGGGNHILVYQNDQLYPTFAVSKSEINKNSQWEVSMLIPLRRIRYRHALLLGYQLDRFTSEEQKKRLDDLSPDFQERLGFLFGGWTFSNAKQYGFSVAPEEGRSIELLYHQALKGLGSDRDRGTTVMNWSEFVRMPGFHHHAWTFSIGQGFSSERIFSQKQASFGDSLNSLDEHMATEEQKSRSKRYGRLLNPLDYAWGSFYATQVGGTLFDKRITQASAAYHFPLAYIERGPGTGSFFLDRLHGTGFITTNRLWDQSFSFASLITTVGARLTADVGLSYVLFPSITLEFKRRTDRHDNGDVSLMIDSRF